MTWTARATVTDVSGTGPTRVAAVADAADPPTKPWGPDGPEVATVVSNTEGKIERVELTVTLDGPVGKLKIGDVLTVSGHFDK